MNPDKLREAYPVRGQYAEIIEERCLLAICRRAGRSEGESRVAVSVDGKTRLFLEGEIFNLGEVLGRIGLSPAECCLALFREDRLEDFKRLNGSFALLILDARDAPRLLLVTDRLCSRPIYLFQKDDRCCFSTSMAALLSFPQVERRLCIQGLVEFFAVRRTSLDHTLYEDIRVVPPASIWSFDGGSPVVKTYWRMRWKHAPCSRGEAPEALAEHLRKAVRRRIGDDRECALLLSGGLDARAILAAAGRPLKTITVAPFENAEANAARRLAEATGGEHVFIPVPPGKVAEGFRHAVPFGGGNYMPPFNFFPAVTEIAERCDVVLSGYGIDYTVRGMYMNNVSVRLGGSVTQLPRLRRASKDRLEEQVAATLRYRSPAAHLRRIFQPPLAAECEARLCRSVREALAAHDGEGLDPQNGWDSYTLCPLSKHYTFGDLLFLRHFVETRTPAYDRDLFDFFLSMPPAWRCSGKVFRKALQILNPRLARLPTSNTGFRADMGSWTALGLVLGRAALRRTGVVSRLSVPEAGATQGSWADFPELLRTHPGLKSRLDAALQDPEVRRLDIFDIGELEAMVQEDRSRTADHGKILTSFLSFVSWMQLYPFTDCIVRENVGGGRAGF
jgi:asparagine synthase (glutamine-hydrolysing)